MNFFSRLIDSSGLIVNKSCSSQRRKIEPFRDRFENWERKSGSFLPSSFSLSFQCFSLVEAHSKRRFSRVFVEGSLLAFKTKFIKRASDARSKIERGVHLFSYEPDCTGQTQESHPLNNGISLFLLHGISLSVTTEERERETGSSPAERLISLRYN